MLQLYKATYTNARVVTKVGQSLSEPLRVGRGALEGDVNSPIFFSIGLESVFRESDELCSALALSGGIKLRDTAYDKVAFADDVTATGYCTEDLSHRLQLLEFSSSKAGLHMSPPKSSTQHIGRSGEAPAVTPMDIRSLTSVPRHGAHAGSRAQQRFVLMRCDTTGERGGVLTKHISPRVR